MDRKHSRCAHTYTIRNGQVVGQGKPIGTGRQEDGTSCHNRERQTRRRNSYPTIHWRGSEAEQIVLGLSIHGQCVKQGTMLQHIIVYELKKLLGYLFPRAKTILVEPLSSHGYSNTRVVKVQPLYTEGGVGRHVVVKFGDTQIIGQEYECYKKYVRNFIGDGRSTTIQAYRCTAYIGGIVYSFLGADTQHMQSFSTFYCQAPIEAIRQMLNLLFHSTCGFWYANHNSLRPLNLTEEYLKQWSYQPENLKHFLETRLPGVLDQEKLVFASLHSQPDRSFHNPFYALKALEPQMYYTYRSTTHGDFNQGNIFVDQTGYPWLIDFQSVAPSHILRDVATLDAMIRLQLLTPEQATLDERLALEEALCGITHFNQLEQLQERYSPTNTAIAKVWQTTIHLRIIAYWLVEKLPSDDMHEYYAALLYVTMNTLSFSSLAVEQCEHALISASLLINNFTQ